MPPLPPLDAPQGRAGSVSADASPAAASLGNLLANHHTAVLAQSADIVERASKRWFSRTAASQLGAALASAGAQKTIEQRARQHLSWLYGSLAELEYLGRPDDNHWRNCRAELTATSQLAPYERLLTHVRNFIRCFRKVTSECGVVSRGGVELLEQVIVRVDCVILTLDRSTDSPLLALDVRNARCEKVERANPRPRYTAASDGEQAVMTRLTGLTGELDEALSFHHELASRGHLPPAVVDSVFQRRWALGRFLSEWTRTLHELVHFRDDPSNQRALAKMAPSARNVFVPRSRREVPF